MYRSILVPVDGTTFGEHALPLAAAIGRAAGAALRLAHVHVPAVAPIGMETVASAGPWSEILKEQQTEYLAGLAARLEAPSQARVSFRVLDGPVPDALESHAQEVGVDLVVMSTHGHAGIRRVWHHGVAEQILEDLPIPVLLVHPRDEEKAPDLSERRGVGHVLIALDGSGDPHAVLDRAIAVGRGFRARYTLLRVVRPPAGAVAARQNPPAAPSAEPAREAARRYLTGFAEPMRAEGLEVAMEVRVDDDPAAAIVGFLREAARTAAPVELVAMARHPHRGFAHALATHTTDAVVRDGGVPVLLVRSSAPLSSPARLESLVVPF